MYKTIQASELRQNLAEALKRVAYEKDSIVIMRRGKKIAAIVPVEQIQTKSSKKPSLDEGRIRKMCKKYQIKELALFGSMTRDDFDENSDVDVLVEFLPEKETNAYDLVDIKFELEQIAGRKVDLVTKRSVLSKQDRASESILSAAEVIYASR